MNLFGKNLARDVVVIAEIGVNHEGSVEAASKLLRLAAEAGADAVKFQSYTPERFVSASDPARLARVTRFGLDQAAHRRLAAEARALGTTFISTAVSEDWVPLIAELGPAVKIASGDLTFEPVIRAAARTGKTVILSTGLGTVEEIDAAVGWVRAEVGADSLVDRLLLMHCVAAYPVPLAEASLRSIPFLMDRYRVCVGYSNHVIGPEACHAAIGLGACAIEVHFTDCKTGREFRDHQLSFEPHELKRLVETATDLRCGLGDGGRTRQPCEEGNVAAMRKGVVAAYDLAPGTILARDDLMYARPATGFAARELEGLLGKRLDVALKRGEVLPRAAIVG